MSNNFSSLFSAVNKSVISAGVLLGIGIAFGVGMAAVASRLRTLLSPELTELTELTELAGLRADMARHADRASQLDHDLRTPIGTVATALQWMNTAVDEPDSQAEGREVIGRQVTRLTKLTEELHDLARQLRS